MMSEVMRKSASGEDTLAFAMFKYRLGLQLAEKEEFLGAYSRFKSSYRKIEKCNLLDASDPKRLEVLDALAEAAGQVGHHLEEVEYRKEILKVCKKHFGKDAPEVVEAMGKLAKSHCDILDFEEEVKLREQILMKCKRIYGDMDAKTVWAWSDFYIALARLDLDSPLLKQKKAYMLELATKLLDGYKKSSVRSRQEFEEMTNKVGELLIFLEVDYQKEKDDMGEELLELAREVYPPDSESLVKYLEYAAIAKEEDGIGLYREAFEIRKKLAENEDELVDAWESFYGYCSMAGDEEGMDRAEAEMDRIRKKRLEDFRKLHEQAGDEDQIPVLLEEGSLLENLGDEEEAVSCLEKALLLCKDEETEEGFAFRRKIADVLYKLRQERAIDIQRDILDFHRRQEAEPDVLFSDTTLLIGFLRSFERYEEALELSEKLLDEMYGEMDPGQIIELLVCMTDCQYELDRNEERLETCSLISAMSRSYYGEVSDETVYAMEHEAEAAEGAGNLEHCVRIRKQVYRIRERNYGEFCPDTIEAFHGWIRSLCLIQKHEAALEKQGEMMERLDSYHPLMESKDISRNRKEAHDMFDGCMILHQTEKAEFSWEEELRRKSLQSLKEERTEEFPNIKHEIFRKLWREANDEISEEVRKDTSEVPWRTEAGTGRSGFWVRVAEDMVLLYYADEYKDYILGFIFYKFP